MFRIRSKSVAGLAWLMVAILVLGAGLPHQHVVDQADTHHHDCGHAPDTPKSPADDSGCSHCAFLHSMATTAASATPSQLPAPTLCGESCPATCLLSGRLVHLSVSARAPPVIS